MRQRMANKTSQRIQAICFNWQSVMPSQIYN